MPRKSKAAKMNNIMPPSLYGVQNSNRNFDDPHSWGKNQFNSSFPAALACYMRDLGTAGVSIKLGADLNTFIAEVPFDEIFGTSLPNNELYFAFESIYEPFRIYVEDQLVSIDLVIKDVNGGYIRPLEVKLTTLPDNTTCSLPEDRWGCELVLRSATLKYMALSIAESCSSPIDKTRIREMFGFCGKIRGWDNEVEALAYFPQIVMALEAFFSEFFERQRPLLLQPIWKTLKNAPVFDEQCLDMFVWTDFALSRLLLYDPTESEEELFSKAQIACYQLARFLYEWSSQERVFLRPIFDMMTSEREIFDALYLNIGPYLRSPRLNFPSIKKEEISNIILGGAEKLLDPSIPAWQFHEIVSASADLFGH